VRDVVDELEVDRAAHDDCRRIAGANPFAAALRPATPVARGADSHDAPVRHAGDRGNHAGVGAQERVAALTCHLAPVQDLLLDGRGQVQQVNDLGA
jgi:hypothetical protein